MDDRLVLIALGGTLAEAGDPQSLEYLSGNALLLSIAEPELVEQVRVIPVTPMSGRNVDPIVMHATARILNDAIEDGARGAVVTSGTDTLEELAYAIELQVPAEIPIALTGAMKRTGDPGSDAVGNLRAALLVAAQPKASAWGPVVVIHEEVHAARWVAKVHTSRLHAFASPGHGPIALVSEGELQVSIPFRAGDYLGLPNAMDVRVELVWIAAGSDGLLINAAVDEADGLVLAGTGGGHVPQQTLAAVERAALRMPVVLASRCLSGSVLSRTYYGPGSETQLQELGLIPAGELSALKARLRLMATLSLGLDPRGVFAA